MGLRFRKSVKITPKWKFIVLGIVILAIIVALISQRSLTSLNVSWEKTSFEVGESTTVQITPDPVDFDLSNISISDDEFASFEFSDGIATVTFKKEGRGTLYFSCGNISSDEYQIEVIDPVAEEQRQKEAQEKAEEEARLEAERQAQEQAERQAEQQKAIQQQSSQQSNQQSTQSQMVWIPQSGSKYHSNASCSGMKNPRQVAIDYAQSSGYEPCKKCY